MSKSSIEKRQEKISSFEEQIEQLKKRKQKEAQLMRKDEQKIRTRRLCSRHGLLESLMPEIINIADEQYKAFLEIAVANTYGKDKLAQVIAKGAKAPTGAGAKPQSETSLKSPLEADQQSTPSKSTATTTQAANPSRPPTKPTEAKPPTTTPQNSVKTEQSGNNGKSKQTTPPTTNHSKSEGSGL